ncbi:RloB family protein [Gordonibacter urolithinfaciens]|uniref:RloB family protein n=1 Tax=Gordonibacter urolithinfaciens TaxID=1335613 RepID=UPI003A9058DB
MIKPKLHLIVSEGTKTELQYFQAFADEVNRRFSGEGRRAADRIRFRVKGVGDNTLAVFEEARRLAREWERETGMPPSHVWVVYDKDDFPDERFDEVERLCRCEQDGETAYHALWSNQCVELWFLLHFENLQSDISRNDYCGKLGDCMRQRGLGDRYRKNDPLLFEKLFPLRIEAMRNAERLMARREEGLPPSKCAPGTKVYELFSELEWCFC